LRQLVVCQFLLSNFLTIMKKLAKKKIAWEFLTLVSVSTVAL